jgi:uncharacterized membrane protein (DUF485 family)
LLLWYNRQVLRKFIAGCAVFLAVTNLPFFFYYDVGFTFFQSVLNAPVASQMYLYDWIPLHAIGALTIAELITVMYNRKINFDFVKLKLGNWKTRKPTQA